MAKKLSQWLNGEFSSLRPSLRLFHIEPKFHCENAKTSVYKFCTGTTSLRLDCRLLRLLFCFVAMNSPSSGRQDNILLVMPLNKQKMLGSPNLGETTRGWWVTTTGSVFMLQHNVLFVEMATKSSVYMSKNTLSCFCCYGWPWASGVYSDNSQNVD